MQGTLLLGPLLADNRCHSVQVVAVSCSTPAHAAAYPFGFVHTVSHLLHSILLALAHPSIQQGKPELATTHLKAPNAGPQTVPPGQTRRVYHICAAGAHAGALLQPGNNKGSSVLRLQLSYSSPHARSWTIIQAASMLAASGCGVC